MSNTDGIASGEGFYIDAQEIENVTKQVNEICNQILDATNKAFMTLKDNNFYQEGKAKLEFETVFKTAAIEAGVSVPLVEPNLYGACTSLAMYYNLVEEFAVFGLRKHTEVDERIAASIESYDASKSETWK